MPKAKVKIIQNPEKEIPAQVLAKAIVDMADGVRAMNRSRLNRNAIVTLIHDYSKVCKRDINIVLNHLDSLEENWLKKQ